jgi:SAM-dependent methyltransferase
MAGSRLNAWNENPDPATLHYHERQWAQPYGSTRSFVDFIKSRVTQYTRVLDLGCGGGAATGYISQAFEHTLFCGMDCSEFLIRLANKHATPNLHFEVGDMEKLPFIHGVDGVISLQTLHILPGYEAALDSIVTKIKPRWMAFSTMVWEGDIDCKIIVTEHRRPRESYSNVYGLPGMKRFLKLRGYECTRFEKYEIDVDLPKVDPDLMGTYTIKTGESRLQCSGPLLFPWGFVMFEKC